MKNTISSTNDPSLRVGVVGLGHWGPNHARHFSRLAQLTGICDSQAARLHKVRDLYPGSRCYQDFGEMLAECPLDAVVIATPTSSHEKLVTAALRAGKHVLCEKPLGLSSRLTRQLCAEARRNRRVLMVGHTFLFNPGIRYLRDTMANRKCGRIFYLHSKRTHYGLFRPDVSVVWDLASHDVAIFNFLLNTEPIEVSAVGHDWLRKGIQDLSFITLRYPGNVMAHVHVSWLDPKKEREIMVVGDKKMLVWQDMASPGPVFIYDRFVVKEPAVMREFGDFQLFPKEGDITIPKLNLEEPLLVQAREFLAAVRENRRPLSDGAFASRIVAVLEAIDQSMKARGKPIKLSRAGVR
ncbi:MAG: Gfo/Idh/MocA family oxidoreductase [Verrucomicrobiae bacterium]|nr:Gfo/Idh/MocA family oxidoreductase [Verrucomicrobiae bacterium]